MDKKSIFIGILLIVLGFGWMMQNSVREQEAREAERLRQLAESQRLIEQQALRDTEPREPGESFVGEDETDPLVDAARELESQSRSQRTPVDRPDVQRITIANDYLRVHLSTRDGAVESIELLEYPETNPRTTDSPDPVRLNEHADIPALSLSRDRGSRYEPLVSYYRIVDQSDRHVVLAAELANGVEVRRTYELSTDRSSGPAPYTIRHRTELRNHGDQSYSLDRLFFNVGVAAPSDADHMGFNLNASLFDNGKYRTIRASQFRPSAMPIFGRDAREFVERRGNVQWGAVSNQFFTMIITPDRPANALIASGVRFPEDPQNGRVPVGVTASMEFATSTIAPDGIEQFTFDFYAGPKDFSRLSRIGNSQEDVMQLGWFLGLFLSIIAFVGKALLSLMGWIQGMVLNWGLAIILTTILIRLLLWPLTAKAARASKRMQKLSKPMQEMREKYKDNPQKLNEEMMKMWKKHKINPLSGCWPVLMQFPIFIAFFNLLRNSSDLRFAPFLWIQDLSMPDASISFGEAHLPLIGNSLNVLPFVWLISMHFQMKMMPQPSVDNAQVKIIRWMPFIFFPFTYFFSSGLVLYWTSTNCFSIFQQYLTNRKRDEEDILIEEEIKESEEKKHLPSGPLIKKKKKKKKGPDGQR